MPLSGSHFRVGVAGGLHRSLLLEPQNAFVSETLSHERVGPLSIDDRYYQLYFRLIPFDRIVCELSACRPTTKRTSKVKPVSNRRRNVEIAKAGNGLIVYTFSPLPKAAISTFFRTTTAAGFRYSDRTGRGKGGHAGAKRP